MSKQNNTRAGRCVIITSYLEGVLSQVYAPKSNDFIIAVDKGLELLTKNHLIPNLIMGDFDSYPDMLDKDILAETLKSSGAQIIISEPEKDDTDTMLAIKKGIDLGYRDFLIVGGIGGRLDHTIANLQALSMCVDNGCNAWISDGFNKATITDASFFRLEKDEGFYFSLLPWSDICTGITICNAKYLLENSTLTKNDPVGVSNEFLDGAAEIYMKNGRLLVILSKDR